MEGMESIGVYIYNAMTSTNLVIISTLIMAVTMSLVVHQYFVTFKFWSSRGVPGPKPVPIFGNAHSWMSGNVEDIDAELTNKYGPVYGVYNGSEPILIVSEPSLIEEIFVKKFNEFRSRMNFNPNDVLASNGVIFGHGDHWKDGRKLFSLALSNLALKNLSFDGKCKNLIKYLNDKNGQTLNMFDTFSHHYLDIVSNVFFGVEMNSFDDPDKNLLDASRDLLARANVFSFFLGYNFPFIAKILNCLHFGNAGQQIARFVSKAIGTRTLSDDMNRNDFLKSLMSAKNLSSDQKIGLAVEVVGAGFLPVLSASTSLIYDLSLNRHALEKVKGEVDALRDKIRISGDAEQTPSFEEIKNLNYLDHCIKESLRMHPTACRNWRSVTIDNDLYIPSLGMNVPLPVGTGISFPVSCLHFNPDIFSDPIKFDPNRWTDANINKWNQSFGSGRRRCVGESFAYLVVKLTMYHFLTNYDIQQMEGTNVCRRPGTLVAHPKKVMIKIIKR